MTLNLQAKTSHVIFDSYGMAVIKGDELSWKDSLGRTVLCWIAYRQHYDLNKAIESCVFFKNGKWRLKRHPKYNEHSSRDHWSYLLINRKLRKVPKRWAGDILYSNEIHLLSYNEFIKDIPFMRGLYLWMHSLTGNKLAERAYYMIYIPGALIGNAWLKLCRWVGRIGKEWSNEDWIAGGNPNAGTQMLYDRTRWQKIWAEIIFQTIPAYPLHNRGWQLYVMPDSKKKERLKRILLRRVGKSNIMLRLLFEPKVIYNTDYLKGTYKLVTQQEVDNIPHMIGFPSGVYMDKTCRRTIRKMTVVEAEFNTYEFDLILYLWKIKN